MKTKFHYFANGMFKIWHGDKHGNHTVYSIDDWGVSGGEVFVKRREDGNIAYPMDNQLKIIGRPLEDMTDEEVLSMGEIPEDYMIIQRAELKFMSRWNLLPFDDLDKLLCMGVIPLPEEDFGIKFLNINDIDEQD